jgi:hypothetical protein
VKSRSLLVAYGTARSWELIEAATKLAAEDSEAEFMLLVPLGPPGPQPYWEQEEDRRLALRQSELAASRLKQAGLRLAGVRAGDADPMHAIRDELKHSPAYTTILICTKHPGVSRWLKLDLASRVRRRFPQFRSVQVIVVEQGHVQQPAH